MDYCTPQNTDLQQHKSNLCNYKCLSYPVGYNLFNNKQKEAVVKWNLPLPLHGIFDWLDKSPL